MPTTYNSQNNSPFRTNRKPTTLNKYTDTGRTPAPAPAPQVQRLTQDKSASLGRPPPPAAPPTYHQTPQYGVSRMDMMPTPQLGGVSGVGPIQPSRLNTSGLQSLPPQTQLPASYNPSAPITPQPAGLGGGQVMGTAPNTRAAYLEGQNRLGGGDLGFGFGEMARRALSRAQQQAGAARVAEGDPVAQTVTPGGFSYSDPRMGGGIGSMVQLPAIGQESADYGFNAIPVAQGGGGSSAPLGGGSNIGSNRSSLVLEGSGADDTQGTRTNQNTTIADSAQDPAHGSAPGDLNELARRLDMEAEQAGDTPLGSQKRIQAARVRALANSTFWGLDGSGNIVDMGGEVHGNIDDPASWSPDVQGFLSEGDFEGPNNLLETGTERNERLDERLGLTAEQQSWADALKDAGYYITETGKIKDLDGNDYGDIYSADRILGGARNAIQPILDAQNKKKEDDELAEYKKRKEEELGKEPDGTFDVEALLQTQNERRALDRAREMRAAMEMASRAGMSPEASTGLSQGMMQASGLAQREAEEKTRTMARMQEIEHGIQMYKMRADMFMQEAQMAQNERIRQQALADAAQARASADKLQRDQMEMQREMAVMSAIGGGAGGALGFLGSLFIGGLPGAATAAGSSVASAPSALAYSTR